MFLRIVHCLKSEVGSTVGFLDSGFLGISLNCIIQCRYCLQRGISSTLFMLYEIVPQFDPMSARRDTIQKVYLFVLRRLFSHKSCVLLFPSRIVHIPRRSLFSRFRPISSVFREEVLYFSCPLDEPVMLIVREVDLSHMSLEVGLGTTLLALLCIVLLDILSPEA